MKVTRSEKVSKAIRLFISAKKKEAIAKEAKQEAEKSARERDMFMTWLKVNSPALAEEIEATLALKEGVV